MFSLVIALLLLLQLQPFVGDLKIDTIGMNEPIVTSKWVEVAREGDVIYKRNQVPDHYVGWAEQSASPGRDGNVILLGHTPGVMSPIKELVLGDAVTVSGRSYHVRGIFIVDLHNVNNADEVARYGHIMEPTQDNRVTLITCYVADGSQLLVIIAKE